MAEGNSFSEDCQMISSNNKRCFGIEKAWQTYGDSYFHIIKPVLLKKKELVQGAYLVDTKLQIQVSGKYFRTVSVTSSGVLNVP